MYPKESSSRRRTTFLFDFNHCLSTLSYQTAENLKIVDRLVNLILCSIQYCDGPRPRSICRHCVQVAACAGSAEPC